MVSEIIYKEVYLADGAFDIIPVQELVRCKDCKYFGEADSVEPKYHECKYFTDLASVFYMLEDDYCSCAKRKDEEE